MLTSKTLNSFKQTFPYEIHNSFPDSDCCSQFISPPCIITQECSWWGDQRSRQRKGRVQSWRCSKRIGRVQSCRWKEGGVQRCSWREEKQSGLIRLVLGCALTNKLKRPRPPEYAIVLTEFWNVQLFDWILWVLGADFWLGLHAQGWIVQLVF